MKQASLLTGISVYSCFMDVAFWRNTWIYYAKTNKENNNTKGSTKKWRRKCTLKMQQEDVSEYENIIKTD